MSERKEPFLRNQALESLLRELNGLLAPVQQEINADFQQPRLPMILLVGCARSGSTLMMQWLAGTGQFAYPTNFLSRFYASPHVGALIQQMLSDPKLQFKDEFSDINPYARFQSDLGKTSGLLAPNEFYYFWRRFFTFGDTQYLTESEQDRVDARGFLSELASIEAVFQKPLAMKGHLIGWNIPFFHSLFPNVLFVHIRRDPVYNAQSLLEAREKFFGDPGQWYSFKPVEFPQLRDLSPQRQVAGQVYFTNRAIQQGLAEIEEIHGLTVDYEKFCDAPGRIYEQVRERLAALGYDLDPRYTGPDHFEPANRVRLSQAEFDRLTAACEEFRGSIA